MKFLKHQFILFYFYNQFKRKNYLYLANIDLAVQGILGYCFFFLIYTSQINIVNLNLEILVCPGYNRVIRYLQNILYRIIIISYFKRCKIYNLMVVVAAQCNHNTIQRQFFFSQFVHAKTTSTYLLYTVFFFYYRFKI